MRYIQHKSGQKLHLVHDLGDKGLSHPICGRKFKHYRMSINVPLGHACKDCLRVFNKERE